MSLPPPPPPPPPAPPADPAPFAAPYAPPRHPQFGASLEAATAPRRALGVVAMCLGLAAALLPWIVVTVAAFQIGLGAGKGIAELPVQTQPDLSLLSGVRDWVLLAEVAFWAGTVLGVWALVQGIVAIVQQRGRTAGILAIVAAALGAVLYAVAAAGGITAGMSAGGTIGG